MSCEFHLTDTDNDTCYAIQQGSTYRFAIFYPGDISTYSFRGQIRRNYADLESATLASFAFTTPTYASYTIGTTTGMYTRVYASLTPTQTQGLTVPSKRRVDADEAAIPGTNVWVYDIEAQAPSPSTDVLKLAKGWVEVDREVTRT